MRIPLEAVDADTLDNIIEAFILREGTDYGEEEMSLAEKISDVKQQLANNQAVLVYSELYETVNIMPADQFEE